MDKCCLCGNKLKVLFLDKKKGAIVKKPGSSKQYLICFECQKKFPSKKEILEKI